MPLYSATCPLPINRKIFRHKAPSAPFSPTDISGLSLWLKADAGVTSGTITPTYISQIIIAGAGEITSNGIYTRSSGGNTVFECSNGNSIYGSGTNWYLSDVIFDDITYANYNSLNASSWEENAGASPPPSAVNTSSSEASFTGVTEWADQSGNGNNATVTPYCNPQIILNQLNGKPAIDFDGTKYFISNNQNLNNNSSIFVVVKSRGNHGTLISTSNQQGINFFLYDTPNNSIAVGVTNLALIANDEANNGNNWMIASTIRSNNLTSIIYKNGSQVTTGDYDTSSLSPNDNLVIGTDADLNQYWNTDGQMAEIIVYTRAVTTPERQQVEAYLNTKYAIY